MKRVHLLITNKDKLLLTLHNGEIKKYGLPKMSMNDESDIHRILEDQLKKLLILDEKLDILEVNIKENNYALVKINKDHVLRDLDLEWIEIHEICEINLLKNSLKLDVVTHLLDYLNHQHLFSLFI